MLRPATPHHHAPTPLLPFDTFASPQGFSHKKNASFAEFHSDSPTTPAVLSECCSCIADGNQRLRGTRGLPECIAEENTPGLLPYVSGSLGVWCAPQHNHSNPAHPPFALADRGLHACMHAMRVAGR